MTVAYGLDTFLPGMMIIGLIGWEDFLVRDGHGSTWVLPTLPMRREYLEDSAINIDSQLIPDEKLTGKIKWYVTPLIFGGSPIEESNIIWVGLQEHCELVRWWNVKYEEHKAKK